jgi:nucleoside-diphosphate-sugar epimerase
VQYPSPLVRLLRLPAVPVNALSLTALEPAEFCLLDVEDAATAFVLALRRRLDGVVNVVGEGSITPYAAARLGGRFPVPILPFGWVPTRALSRVVGTPVPAHLHELLTRGRLADGSRAAELLGAAPTRTTADVVAALYDWAPVVYSRPSLAA